VPVELEDVGVTAGRLHLAGSWIEAGEHDVEWND